jgi:two-component system, LytTR family, sensor kinase
MFKRPRFWIFYTAAWIPYAVSYFLAFASVPSLRSIAFIQTLYNIGPAALLGVGVLRWSQLFPWSRHIRPWFYPLQVASALTYSLLWCVTALLTGSLAHAIATHHFVFGHFSSYAFQWEFFSGLMIYGNIVGFANIAQISRTLAEEERRRTVAESLKSKAELAVLRAQLNPHFLFNTLNSLAALVGQNPDHAGEALMQLGDMLRYTLNEHRSNSDDDVSLRDELLFTDNYLALEGLRLGDRLKVLRSIDPTTLSCRLPALTIQPLVENAIRHGIAPRSKGGSLAISAKREEGKLLLSVSDDGVGTEPQKALTSAGLGIRTVQQRLFLYSHGASSFAVEGKPGEGFVVSIALPLEKPEEEENVSVKRFAELGTR